MDGLGRIRFRGGGALTRQPARPAPTLQEALSAQAPPPFPFMAAGGAPAPAQQAPGGEPFPFPRSTVQPWEIEQRRAYVEQNPGATIGALVGGRPAPPDRTPPPDRIPVPEGRPDYWAPQVPGRMNPPREAFPFPMVNPPPGAPVPEDPLRMGSRVTGAPYDYLRSLAGQEGMDDPEARNPRSSATGLMQFTKSTFDQMLNEHGAEYGLPEGLTQAQRMELRNSPHWSALLGGELYNQSARSLETRLGRGVSPAEIYAGGHFLGDAAGGFMLGEVDAGRGNRDAREAVRAYYRQVGAPGQGEAVIAQNPRQFAPGRTVADVMRMQTEDFVAHGEARGADGGALRRRRSQVESSGRWTR